VIAGVTVSPVLETMILLVVISQAILHYCNRDARQARCRARRSGPDRVKSAPTAVSSDFPASPPVAAGLDPDAESRERTGPAVQEIPAKWELFPDPWKAAGIFSCLRSAGPRKGTPWLAGSC
jgi:hypothetical protein